MDIRISAFLVKRQRPLQHDPDRSVCAAYSIDGILIYSTDGVLTYSIDGIPTYSIVKGAFNTTLFFQFMEEKVLPLCNPFPGPRSIVVMDNVAFHRHSVLYTGIRTVSI